jgi:murein DD-endopeptidase MepM/ murein hydrolase activator NlpD
MRPRGPKGNRHSSGAAASGVVIALTVWLSAAAVGLVASLSEASERARVQQSSGGELAVDGETPSAGLREQLEVRQAGAGQPETGIATPPSAKMAVDPRPDSPEPKQTMAILPRNEAFDRLRKMRQAVAAAASALDRDAAAEPRLQQREPLAEPASIAPSEQRHAELRVDNRLQQRLADWRGEVAHLHSQGSTMRLWLQDWVLGSVGTLEDLVDETGVDVERLIARAGRRPAPAQGGPLQVAAPDEIGAGVASKDPMSWDIQRLAVLRRVARSLPLAPPLDRFRVTSPFGKRRDPFTDTWAYHSGIDLGAPRHAVVLAPAPGRVIFAGPSGPYGNTVEIAHGMGIVTRYGHLRSFAVEVGQRVSFRTPIGVVGSTGRSTSRHLHYEIRIDDQLLDPARFLDAGRLLAGNSDASGRELVKHPRQAAASSFN